MAKQRKPKNSLPTGTNRQEYASNRMKEKMSGFKITDMSPSAKKAYLDKSTAAYNNAAMDYQASTMNDAVLGISSKPREGARFAALGMGYNLTPKTYYDSKGNKVVPFEKTKKKK